jgi:oligopeptide transport system substrate-binding protein
MEEKMKKVRILALAAIALAALGLAGCGGKTGAAAGSRPEGQINVVFGGEPGSLDPTLASTMNGMRYLHHLFEGLYKYEDNGSGIAALVPGLAEAAPEKTVHADGTVTYVFKLREGLKWSDGQDLTADAFVYSWRRLVDPRTAADYNYMLDMVQNAIEIQEETLPPEALGIKAVDSRTLEITLTYDCPYFMEIAAFSTAFPLRKDVIDLAGDQWTFEPATFISDGPYRVKEWVHNSYILAEKNPHYYAPVSGPETIRFALMTDANSVLVGFRNGSLDFVVHIPMDEIPALLASGELHIIDTMGTYYVVFNHSKPPFDDVRIRRAFSLAIDRNHIVRQITQTGERPASGFVPWGIFDEGGPGSDFRDQGKEYYSVAESDYRANVAEARRLLAEAGYPEGKGFPILEYLYIGDDASERPVAEALQDMWQTELGVTVSLVGEDWPVFLDSLYSHDYTAGGYAWIADYNDPSSLLDLVTTGSNNNTSLYSNREYDSLIARAKGSGNAEERFRLFHQAEDIAIGQDVAVAPIYAFTTPYMLSPRLSGFFYSPQYVFFKNVKIAGE